MYLVNILLQQCSYEMFMPCPGLTTRAGIQGASVGAGGGEACSLGSSYLLVKWKMAHKMQLEMYLERDCTTMPGTCT